MGGNNFILGSCAFYNIKNFKKYMKKSVSSPQSKRLIISNENKGLGGFML